MPDYSFTNSLGKKISLSDFNGQAYAYTFIFTRCPFPTFCPRMNMNLAAAYKQLTETPNAPTNWHLISISFDPDFDTPERLAQYSSLMYKPDPKKWSWVTGAMIDIDAIADQVGLVFAYENNTFTHNLRTVVVDKNGIIRQNFRANEWKPEDLVKEIVAGAEGKKAPGAVLEQDSRAVRSSSSIRLRLIRSQKTRLIEPFICRIKLRDGDIQNLQLSDRAVAAARLDHDGTHRPHRDALAIEFHLADPFQDHINLGHPLVVMRLRVGLDLHLVNACNAVLR